MVKNKPSFELGSFSFLPLAVLGAITLVGLGLRITRLELQPLWWDEGYSVFFATRDLTALLERTALDIHPPLYYLVLQVWMIAFGKGVTTIRLLSVVIGLVSIPLLYALVYRLLNDRRVALVAALLLATSPLHVYYSQEVRMYGLVTLLGLASVLLAVQLSRMPVGTLKTALVASLYIGVSAAALYTQYYAAFILAAEIAAVLITAFHQPNTPNRLKALTHWVGAWASIGLLYVPWIVYAVPKLYAYVTSKVAHEAYPSLDPITFAADHLAAFSVGHVTGWPWMSWAGVVLVGLAVMGTWASRPGRGESGIGQRPSHGLTPAKAAPPIAPAPITFILLYFLVPLVLAYGVNLRFPFAPVHRERLLLIVAPAFYVLAAMGVVALTARRRVIGVAGLAIAMVVSAASLFNFYTILRYADDDYRPLIAQVQAMAQPNDLFLAIYPWQIGYLETYYTGAPLAVVEAPSDGWIANPARLKAEIDSLIATHGRTWIPAHQTLGRLLEDALDAQLRPTEYVVLDTWFGATRLELFASAGDPPPSNKPLAFRDGERAVSIADWGVSQEPVTAGEGIIRIWVDTRSIPNGTLKASLRLIDANGSLWVQDDRDLESSTLRVGFAVPAGTPPGDYELRLAVYRARDRTALVTAGGADDISLAHVTLRAPAKPILAAIPNRVDTDIGAGLRLAGYENPSRALRPGEPAGIVLYWQATQPVGSDLRTAIQIQSDSGSVVARTLTAPAKGIYATSRWKPNELIRDPQTLTVRGDTPDGTYRVLVSVVDAANQTLGSAIIGSVEIRGRPHYFGAPSPSHAIGVRFGESVRLVGYDYAIGSDSLRLVLYWQALGPLDVSLKGFAHLLDRDGKLIAQRDQVPGDGAYPTTSWVKNEYLVDVYEIAISAGQDQPTSEIQVGLYDAATGARLPCLDESGQPAGDHVTIPVQMP